MIASFPKPLLICKSNRHKSLTQKNKSTTITKEKRLRKVVIIPEKHMELLIHLMLALSSHSYQGLLNKPYEQ